MQIASIAAVAGAWTAGLAVLVSIYCFCFSTIKLKLLRFGFIWLVVTDAGLIVMLGSLVVLFSSSSPAFPNADNTTLLVFSVIGLVVLIALTAAAGVISRVALARNRIVQAFDQSRRTLEY